MTYWGVLCHCFVTAQRCAPPVPHQCSTSASPVPHQGLRLVSRTLPVDVTYDQSWEREILSFHSVSTIKFRFFTFSYFVLSLLSFSRYYPILRIASQLDCDSSGDFSEKTRRKSCVSLYQMNWTNGPMSNWRDHRSFGSKPILISRLPLRLLTDKRAQRICMTRKWYHFIDFASLLQ